MDLFEGIKKRFSFLVSQYDFIYLGDERVWHVDVFHYRKGTLGIGLEYESPWNVTPIFIIYNSEVEPTDYLHDIDCEFGKSVYSVLSEHNDTNYLTLLKQSHEIANRGKKRNNKEMLEKIFSLELDLIAQSVDLYLRRYWPEIRMWEVDNIQISKSIRRDTQDDM